MKLNLKKNLHSKMSYGIINIFFYWKASDRCEVNLNYVPTAGLQNYCTFCSNLTDLITNLTLFNEFNAALISDRNGFNSSALNLSKGYVQAPNGVYFDGGNFTVMAWIYPRAFNSYSRLIDFGNGENNDNVICTISEGTSGKVRTAFFNSSILFGLTSNQTLQLNKWQHVAFTFSPLKDASIYVNGKLTAQLVNPQVRPNNVTRTKNYIGKSYSTNDGLANAIFDELKIFSVALNQSQVQFEMNNDFYDLLSPPNSLTTSLSTSLTI